ncbi:MAG: multiprotein bridging factor aMBF1 [Candidatus Micrarchaeota archaeon]|nr:multiprotein bridging factor aMBF1 [Candidatus Micrarchaeota archaeon]
MECESCGKKIENNQFYLVLIEGAKLNVCKECSSLGKILQRPIFSTDTKNKKPISSSTLSEPEYELVEDFGKKISQARQKLGISLAVLAERLAQKESYLERIEKEKTIPPLSLVKKLEYELGVKLLSSNSLEVSTTSPSASNDLTLGDILEVDKKKKK